jgi:transposase-like protein
MARLRAVLAILRGAPPAKTAAEAHIDEATLYAWRDAFTNGGLGALRDPARSVRPRARRRPLRPIGVSRRRPRPRRRRKRPRRLRLLRPSSSRTKRSRSCRRSATTCSPHLA